MAMCPTRMGEEMRNTLVNPIITRRAAPVWQVQPQQQQFAKKDDDDPDENEDPDDDDPDDDEDDDDEDEKPAAKSKSKKGAKPDDDDEDDEDDPKRHARKWEKRAKTSNAQLEAVKKALGITKDLTPEELDEKLKTATNEQVELRQENAVIRAASAAGIDEDKFLDSRSFMAKLDDIDPDLDRKAYNVKVKKIVDAWIEDKGIKPEGTKKRRSSGSSGTPSGSGGGKSQLTREDLAKMSPRDIEKARADGRLNDILGIKV